MVCQIGIVSCLQVQATKRYKLQTLHQHIFTDINSFSLAYPQAT